MHPPSHADAGPWFVAIGASGQAGLDDVGALLGALGSGLDAVVMVVLHRLFDEPSALASVLGRATAMPVIVAENGERLERGCCYIGEPAAHLTLMARSFGEVTADAARLHRNRTVDLLFESVALQAGSRGIGVVLSGGLDDGSRGLEAIHVAGGRTMVLLREPQAEGAQPRAAGMPENAIGYGRPIDLIGSTLEIAGAIRSAVARQHDLDPA